MKPKLTSHTDLDICMWRDLFILHRDLDMDTTFIGYENWEESHPLYKCTKCNGKDTSCPGYKSLRDIGRYKG